MTDHNRASGAATIRPVRATDLDEATEVERRCFPSAEAASKEALAARIKAYPGHFLVLEIDGQVCGFINGMVTDAETISDEMFGDAGLHKDRGRWQSVFGLDVLPERRHQGYASQLMRALIGLARREGRSGCILTCKEHLLDFYASFGYTNKGISASVHGGAVWYDMILRF